MFSFETPGLPDAESVLDYNHLKVEEFIEDITLKDGLCLVRKV